MTQTLFNLTALRWKYLQTATAVAAAVLFFWPGVGLALDPSRDLLQYNCQTWSRANGLPVNGINGIVQTKDGFIWMGTSMGLMRFDGMEFKVHDLGNDAKADNCIVTSVASSRTGGIWAGLSHSSFGYCDGDKFDFRGRPGWGGMHLNVEAVLETGDGRLWLAADGMVAALDPSGKFEQVLSESNGLNYNFLCACTGREGRLWFGTATHGVYCWRDGKVTKLADPALDNAYIHSLAEDKQGHLWVGTPHDLYCYDTNLARMDIPSFPPTDVRTLLVDREGVLWIGTSGLGVARLQDGGYAYLRKTDGLAGDYVTALAEDREGDLWVGSRDGLSELTDIKFSTHKAADDPAATDALAVCASRLGGIWIGSPQGLTYYDGKAKTYGFDAGLTSTYTKRVFEASDGDVYLVSDVSKLGIFSGGKIVKSYEASNMVVGMAEDSHGVVVSVGGDLYRASRDNFTPYVFTNGDPGMAWILNLAPGRDGEIWVASVSGIFRVKDGAYQRWGPAEGLTEPGIQDVEWVCEGSDGVVWAGGICGIIRLKDNKVRFITQKDGLMDNNIYSIVPDDFGQLWVDSGRGIFSVNRENINRLADGKTNHVEYVAYNGPEALKSSDKTTQEHVACKSRDGRIWFPTANGVVEIDPSHIPVNQIPPPVVIESIRANGTEMSPASRVIVPPGQGELEIQFAALSFIAQHKIKLRYQLEGYDNGWVETTDRRLAHYTNLKPGSYKFRVVAANADGIWNEIGDTVEIKLRPHYYQTAWFHLLCVGLGCGIVAAIVARKVRRVRRRHQDLQRTQALLEAEVLSRTADLAKANDSLQHEVEDHRKTEVELKQRSQSLEKEIEQRARMQLEVERVHRELLETSRLAGMSEIATNVLHNVGNVLNSVNISATLVAENVTHSRAGNLARVVALLQEHEHDLGTFITTDPRGRHIPTYLAKLSDQIQAERAVALGEVESLRTNIEHIKEIVTVQQNYARVSGVKEIVDVQSLVEDSLRMNLGSLERHGAKVIRDYQQVPPIIVEKHKILQILINLLGNAKYACDDSGKPDKQVTLRVANGNGRIKISVMDNGIGIPQENLNRIFSHGFTTRKNGHGFGLHSGALAAKEMGGCLTARSEGPGKGACFTLELPVTASGGTS